MPEPTESISLDELTNALKTAVADGVKSLHDNAQNKLESSLSSAEKILEKKLSSDNPKIEIPTISAKKGGNYANLPVHEKQLANILLRRDAFFGMEAVKQVEKSYKKDFDASTSGSGLEYIPTNLQTRLFEDLELEPGIFNLFENITMSQQKQLFPNVEGNVHFKISSKDGLAKSAGGGQTTDQLTIDNTNFTAYVDYSDDLDDNSVVAMLPLIQQSLVRGWARDLDDAIINGDSSATHMDTDIALLGADYHLKAWKGLRKLALAGSLINSGDGSAIDTADIIATLKVMKKYSARMKDLAVLVSTPAQFSLWSSEDWKDSTLMLAKWGTDEEIGKGLIGYVKGVPVYNSEFVRSDVNAGGAINSSTGNTFTFALAFNKKMFVRSISKEFRMWVITGQTDAALAENQLNRVHARIKASFTPVFTPGTGKETVAICRNIDD